MSLSYQIANSTWKAHNKHITQKIHILILTKAKNSTKNNSIISTIKITYMLKQIFDYPSIHYIKRDKKPKNERKNSKQFNTGSKSTTTGSNDKWQITNYTNKHKLTKDFQSKLY